MPIVLRQRGFDLKINTDDHEPMHVHVWYQGNLLVVNFHNEVAVRNNYGFNNNEIRRVKRIIGENQAYFQQRWREIHNE